MPSTSFQEPQLPIHAGEIERFEIEAAAEPHAPFLVLRVVGGADYFQQFRVARSVAAVLGRTATLPRQADRMSEWLLRRLDLLDHELVLPAVAEVVHVAK